MKIAITGHTHGIGEAFAKQLSARGHEIIGISRRDGENIKRVLHTAILIEPATLFINNAQSTYAQTELLYEVWKRWKGLDKWIWNISTMLTEAPTMIDIEVPGQDDWRMSQYRNQKLSLEEACRQLRYMDSQPQQSIIRPGAVATYPPIDKKVNTDQWVKAILETFYRNPDLHISEISVGHCDKRIDL